MSYDKDKLKASLSLDDIYNVLDYWQADPRETDNGFVCRTVCHNGAGEGSKKLYFLGEDGMGIFHCFTGCDPENFDIIDLVRKVEHIDNLNQAIEWLVFYFHLEGQIEDVDQSEVLEDFKIFRQWDKIDSRQEKKQEIIKLPEKDIKFLKNYPDANPEMVDKNISKKVLRHYGIKYDPVEMCWLVPHIDQDNRIVGVRRRTLDKNKEKFGKYRPWTHLGIEYNHPLGFNLFSDSYFWKNIEKSHTAIIGESEKFVMQYSTYFGIKNNIACAMCGSNLSDYQARLLREHGVTDLIIGVDKDYRNYSEDNFKRYIKKIYSFWRKYDSRYNLSFLIDRKNKLAYKDAPTDEGKRIFLDILRDRRILTEEDFVKWI